MAWESNSGELTRWSATAAAEFQSEIEAEAA